MAMYYYARKLQKSARKVKTTPPPQQTPIRTNTNGSIPGCTTVISSTGLISGPGAGVGCNSQLNASSLSPGSSDSGQLQQQPQTQQQLQQLQLSIQNLGLSLPTNDTTGNGSIGETSAQQHQHQQLLVPQQTAQCSRSPPPSISTVAGNSHLLQKEWEKIGLVFQDSNLVSGTLDALIQYLVPTPSYYPDRALIFAFLLSSRLHIRPHELLGAVFRLAFAPKGHMTLVTSPEGAASSSSSNNTGEDPQLKTVSHMVQLLGEWAELFPYDFRDDKMMAHVRAITQKCVSIDPKVRKDVSLLLTSLLSRLTSLERYEAFLHKVAVEIPPEDQAMSAPSILAICPDPNLLAEQLTHIELERLSHIGPEEFVQAFVKEVTDSTVSPECFNNLHNGGNNQNSSTSPPTPLQNGTNGSDPYSINGYGGAGMHNGSISGSTASSSSDGGRLPGTSKGTTASNSASTSKESRKTHNLESYVKWFNRLCYIIATDVCKAKKKKVRVRCLEYWVEVAKECFNIGNFNSLMAIITGLNMSPVLRMKKTWDKVNCDLLSSLEQHMDPSSNFSAYRSLLKSVAWHATNPSGGDARGKTVIPFFSLLIKDLYFLHQGCASRLPNGHINFEKCWQLAKQVTQLITWQQVQCPFPKVPKIIHSIQTIPALNENALLLASFECESPDTVDEKERLKNIQEETDLFINGHHQNCTMPSISSAVCENMMMVMSTTTSPCSHSTISASQYPFYLQQPYLLLPTMDANFHPSQFLEQGETHALLEIPMGVPPPPPHSSESSPKNEQGNGAGKESIQIQPSSPS